MSRWWRAYDEAVDDPKLILLNDKQFRAWFNLCCITSQNGGKFPPTSVVAVKLRVTPAKAKLIIAELAALGLIDVTEDGSSMHNWHGRQYKSDVTDPTNSERQKRHRDRHRNARNTVTDTVTVTPPREQNTETETDSEKRKTRASALADPWVEQDWQRFWEEFPNKVGKADARKAFEKATRKVEPQILFHALQKYARKQDDRPFCNPSTWLNQERWSDQPAAQNVQRTNGSQSRSSSADFFAGIAGLAADIAGNSQSSWPADEEIPRGRIEIDG